MTRDPTWSLSLAGGLSVGICAALSHDIPAILAWSITALCLILAIRTKGVVHPVALFLCMIGLGASRAGNCQNATMSISAAWPANGHRVDVRGRIEPLFNSGIRDSRQFKLVVSSVRARHGFDVPLSDVIRVRLPRNSTSTHRGVVRILGRISHSRSKWSCGPPLAALTHRITLYCDRAEHIRPSSELSRWRRALTHFRRHVYAAFDSGLSDTQSRSVLRATILGDSSLLLPETSAAFRRSGSAHYLALSGLHVGLLAGIVWGLGRACTLPVRGRAIVALMVLLAYGGLVDGGPSVFRSVWMGCMVCSARVLTRKCPPIHAFGLAACVALLRTPGDLIEPGFQLSFAITLVLIARLSRVTPPLAPAGRLSRGMRTAWQALTISVIAWLAAAPLVALHFEQFHPLGWLCSWLLIPLATLSTMLGFLKLGLTAIAGEHSQLLAPLCMWMTRAFVTQVHWLAQLPGVELNCPCPSAGLLLVTLAALATLLLHSHARTITLLTLAAQAVVVATTANSVGSGPALVALPGDRGFSAFVRSSDGSATALDPGPALGCGSSAKLRRGLAQLGVYKVRTIVITSVERDRMSGILALLDAWPDARVWITGHFERAAPPGSSADQVLDSLAHRGIVPMRLFAGQTVKEEAIQTTVWGPPVTLESGVSHRAASLTLELRVGRHRVAVYGPSERRAHHPEIAGPPDVDAIVVLDNQPEVPGAHGCPMALRWCVPDETVGARDLNEVVVTNRALIVPIIDRRPPSPPYAAGSTSRTPESARGAPGMYR